MPIAAKAGPLLSLVEAAAAADRVRPAMGSMLGVGSTLGDVPGCCGLLPVVELRTSAKLQCDIAWFCQVNGCF